MTMGSSRAGSGAGRLVSGAVTGIVIRHVREHKGDAGVRRLLAGARDRRRPSELEDPTEGSSHEQVVALFESASRVLGDPEVARHLGREMLEQYRGTQIEPLMRSAGSTTALLSASVAALGRMLPAVETLIVEVGKHHAVVSARTSRGLSRPLCLCDLSKGFLEQVPGFAGDTGEIEESECQARGGRLCCYRIAWSRCTRAAAVTTAGNQPEPLHEIRDDSEGPENVQETSAAVAPERATGDRHAARVDEVEVATLDEQVKRLSERLEEAYLTAADLLAADSTHGVLGRIADRAARAVGAPRHLLVVRTSLSGETEVHARGFTEEEKDELAPRILNASEHSFGADVLMVDIASSRSHYGRLAAYAPSSGFADDDQQILAAYAAYAATALDVVTALEQARRSNESASALLDFSRALAGVSTVDEVAQRLAETVPLVTGCARSTVMLWDPSEQTLTVRGATGPGAEQARADHTEEDRAGYKLHRHSTSLFEKIMRSHDLVVVDLDSDDPIVHSVLEGTGTACSVIAPLSASDEFFGIVTANFDTPPAFDPRGDIELQTRLISLADHAVTAMQNTRLLEQVTHLAWHDALTGLPNRRLLEDRVNQELVRARRNGESICMFFIDLDRLKQVNDTFGHAAGDDLIRHVAERLVDTVRRQDTVARLGGDEFAVLLPGLADLGDIDTLARRTLEALRRRYNVAGRDVHVSGSIGVAVAPGHGETYDELLSNADAAMYRAKSLGRDTYQLYSVPDGGARPDVQLEVDLKHAVERSEMIVLYQPVVDMRTSDVVAAEALTRWQHPVRGVLDPESFLALARDQEVIAGLDTWVVSEACRQMAAWAASGVARLRVSVNVAARSLAVEGFAASIENAIRAWGIDPAMIELEVPDLGTLDAEGPARRSVDQLVAVGVHFAVDDVGTASAASSRLGSVPVSTLKLDRSFVQLLGEDDETAALVAAIVTLTERQGIRVVAEGVETQQQARTLLAQGCRFGQGFLFSPPLLPSDIEQMLRGPEGPSGEQGSLDNGTTEGVSEDT
jgi:diguanylate cyclase (GGDEF)-like protein